MKPVFSKEVLLITDIIRYCTELSIRKMKVFCDKKLRKHC